MAKYRTLPNYELQRPEIHIKFSIDGIYETNDGAEIAYLNKCTPFIERLDREQKEVVVKPTNTKPKPRQK